MPSSYENHLIFLNTILKEPYKAEVQISAISTMHLIRIADALEAMAGLLETTINERIDQRIGDHIDSCHDYS